jgi:hypothetical protein
MSGKYDVARDQVINKKMKNQEKSSPMDIPEILPMLILLPDIEPLRRIDFSQRLSLDSCILLVKEKFKELTNLKIKEFAINQLLIYNVLQRGIIFLKTPKSTRIEYQFIYA